MRYLSKQFLGYGWLCAALLGAAACSPRRIPPLTVEDLMEDRVALDGIMMKCNQTSINRDTADCENARIAIERLADQNVDPSIEKRRQAAFEQAREQLRLAQDKLRREEEAKTKVDPYSLPVLPVNPTPPAASPPPAGQPRAVTGAFPGGAPVGNARLKAGPPALAETSEP